MLIEIICIILILFIIICGFLFFLYNHSKKNNNARRKIPSDLSIDKKNLKYCFIINPSKPKSKEAEETILKVLEETKIKNYSFKHTTIDDAGNAQAREAIDEGADVIIAVGGDGTIRSVVCGIIKSENSRAKDIEVGLIPNGTGNVLAHNLGIPNKNIEEACKVALFEKAKKIDIGLCKKSKDDGFQHIFITIAGVGFDANMVKETDKKTKRKLGSFAYYLAGIKEVFAPKFTANIKITLPDGKEMKSKGKMRSIMVGNCGKIPGFILIPNAKTNDGLLDTVVIDTKGGLLGWFHLGSEILLQKFNFEIKSQYKLGRIEHIQGTEIEIKLAKPQYMQLDGDLHKEVDYLKFNVSAEEINFRYPEHQ